MGKHTVERTVEHRAKLAAANTGKIVSDETKLKMSLAKKGRPSPNKGRRLSDEARARIKAGQQARRAREAANGGSPKRGPMSEETLNKIRTACRVAALRMTDEHKAKLSVAQRARRLRESSLVK